MNVQSGMQSILLFCLWWYFTCHGHFSKWKCRNGQPCPECVCFPTWSRL